MRTIDINGITFTDQAPSGEGYWLITNDENASAFLANLPILVRTRMDFSDTKTVWFHDNPASYSMKTHGGELWHELVPRQKFAKHLEWAYSEGMNDMEASLGRTQDQLWEASETKRLTEGTKP